MRNEDQWEQVRNMDLKPEARGITPEWVIGYLPGDVTQEYREAVTDAFAEFAALNPKPEARGVVDVDATEALRFLLDRIGSWTNARWDQHLRHEFGDDRATKMIAALTEAAK